jgi:RNA polymerase sigma-70 factor (ECF subfamily)
MTDTDALELFERERPRLAALAYRMLGERAAAEDVVQDSWLKWAAADQDTIANPAAWLTTVTTRGAIDALTSARARRERYVGPWLPEAIVAFEESPATPQDALERQEDVNLALMWAMERLAPEERAAYLLHDVFDAGYDDIAAALQKTEAACRQLVSRARKRVQKDSPRFDVSAEEVSALLDRFMTATASLDKAEILSLLAPDAVAISDGGGRVSAALRPLEGPEDIAKVWLAVASRRADAPAPRKVLANGLPALAILDGTEDDMIISVMPGRGGGIGWIYILRNPEKLTGLRA